MKYDYVVAADGSGDFRTIQEALHATWERDKHWWKRMWRVFRPWRILTLAGTYTEPINLSANDPKIRFEGCTFEGGSQGPND